MDRIGQRPSNSLAYIRSLEIGTHVSVVARYDLCRPGWRRRLARVLQRPLTADYAMGLFVVTGIDRERGIVHGTDVISGEVVE